MPASRPNFLSSVSSSTIATALGERDRHLRQRELVRASLVAVPGPAAHAALPRFA